MTAFIIHDSVLPFQQLQKPHSLPHPRALDKNTTKSLQTKLQSFHTSPSLNKSPCESVLASEWYCVNVKHIGLEMSQDGTFANFSSRLLHGAVVRWYPIFLFVTHYVYCCCKVKLSNATYVYFNLKLFYSVLFPTIPALPKLLGSYVQLSFFFFTMLI